MTETCDKHRRPIRVGDVLKVYHFTGARRKKHFMYKQVVGTELLGGEGNRRPYFSVSHLDMDDKRYWIGMTDGILEDYEIVQCPTADFEDREKVEP